MKGELDKIERFLDGASFRFVIPVYQRNYDWKIEQCKQLYTDMVKLIKEKRPNHFIGSIVCIGSDDENTYENYIIDGQQRLTTISLLLLAMHNLLGEGKITSLDNRLKERIQDLLVDKFATEESKLKLKPIKNDSAAYQKLFGDKEEYIKSSNLTINYNYFYERIQKQEISIDELYTAFKKLVFIKISLKDGEDDPQLIFESLNSTGLDLTEADKIRNFILMGQNPKTQERFYEKYWNKIEVLTNYDVSTFIRDWLSLKQLRIPNQQNVYRDFKEYIETKKCDIEETLDNLLTYAKRYNYLLNGVDFSRELNAVITRLCHLDNAVTRPFLLEVLTLYENNDLTINDVVQAFRFTENYIVRRIICGVPTSALNKIFLILNKDVLRYDGTPNNYLEKLKYTLAIKKDSSRYPTDREFIEQFSNKNIYGSMKSKYVTYLFERFENEDNREDKDIYRHIEDGTYSIEHIMPQTLTPSWQRELGSDYMRISEEWSNRIANLTLTGYNSKLSNSSFNEKKFMDGGYIESGIKMNQFIAKFDKWTEDELKRRNEHLMKQAIKIWAYPVSNYTPEVKKLPSCTLSSDVVLTGEKISKFEFEGVQYSVKSWRELIVQMIRILYQQDPEPIKQLALSTNTTTALNAHFGFSKEGFRAPEEIADGIFYNTHSSTVAKQSELINLLDIYNIDPSEITIYFKEESK